MATNGAVVNQAAVNSGANIVQFGSAAVLAVATLTGAITYVHKTDIVQPAVAVLESYVWQRHNVAQLASANASISTGGYVRKWETANFSGRATGSAFTLTFGANGIFNGVATIQPNPRYIRRATASNTTSATFDTSQFIYSRAESSGQGTAVFYPDAMLKLSGATIYTHDGSVKPTILANAVFNKIFTVLRPDGWFAQGTSSVQAIANYKTFLKTHAQAMCTTRVNLFTNFRDMPIFTGVANLMAPPSKKAYAIANLAATATISGRTAKARYFTKATNVAVGASTATPFVDRFGGYPLFITTANIYQSLMIQVHSASAFSGATGTAGNINADQWTIHQGATAMAVSAVVVGELSAFKPSDAVTFIRTAEVKDFERPPETKDFTRAVT